MALTPDEIHAREFHLADRGYDRSEVRAFLAEIAGQLAALASASSSGASRSGEGPLPAAEERLLLVLDAARRAVETVRAEAVRAIDDVRAHAAPPEPAVEVDELRDRLAAALRDVETALGVIDPGVQRTEPSTRPNS